MKIFLFFFRVLMIATLINIVKEGAVQAAPTAKDLPSWPAKHRHKFNVFEAGSTLAFSGKTPSCNLKITQEANATFFKVFIQKNTHNNLDENSNNKNQEHQPKETPNMQVLFSFFFASDLPKSGSAAG